MDNNNYKSILKMVDLYFSKFNFENDKNGNNGKLNINYKIKYLKNAESENMVKVMIDTNISSENNSISLDLQTIGIFEIDPKGLDAETKKFILNRNTVSIMFPFIRSQISLLTAQPGLQPIMLQPIDVNLLVENKTD